MFAGGATLALHLDDLGDAAPDILLALGRPLVRQLAHGRGRGDRVDGDDLVGLVRDMRRGLVAVDDDAVAAHAVSLQFCTGATA